VPCDAGAAEVRGSGAGEGQPLSDDDSELERRASYLADSGDYAAAVEVQRRLVEAREQSLGAEHPSTLTARFNLAL
jgi:hypothetical protein